MKVDNSIALSKDTYTYAYDRMLDAVCLMTVSVDAPE